MGAEVVYKSCLYGEQDKGATSHAQHNTIDELKISVEK